MVNRKRHTTVYKKKHSSQKKSKKNRKNSRTGKNKRRITKRNYMRGGVVPLTREELEELHGEITTAFTEHFIQMSDYDIKVLQPEQLKSIILKLLITEEEKTKITEINRHKSPVPEHITHTDLKLIQQIALKKYIQNDIEVMTIPQFENILDIFTDINKFLTYVERLIFVSGLNAYRTKNYNNARNFTPDDLAH